MGAGGFAPTRKLPRTPGRPLPPPGGRSPGEWGRGGSDAQAHNSQRTTRASLGTHRAQRARGPGQRVRPGLWRPTVRASAGSMLERPYVTPPVGAAASEGRHAASASSFGAQSPAGGQRALTGSSSAPSLERVGGALPRATRQASRGFTSDKFPPRGGQSAGAGGHRSRERSGPLGTGSPAETKVGGRHFQATPR